MVYEFILISNISLKFDVKSSSLIRLDLSKNSKYLESYESTYLS